MKQSSVVGLYRTASIAAAVLSTDFIADEVPARATVEFIGVLLDTPD